MWPPAPAARGGALPYGRLFEKRPTPGFSGPTGRPGFNDLVYRQPPQDASSSTPARPRSLADIPGSMFQQVAAKTGAQLQQGALLSQSIPPARPASAKPSSPQTPAQGRGPALPAPGSRPAAPGPASKHAPAQGPAPQSPAAHGQPQQRRPTPEQLDELFTKEGKPRKPVGQLGIKGGKGLGIDGKPSTVCLYDGGETRKKCGGNSCVADAYALQQAAATYASDGTWMINIANPDWRKQLASIKSAEERNGRYIDRIMIFDHGGTAKQEFSARSEDGKATGDKLKPGSKDWQLITSSVRPRGDVVLAGCSVADQDWYNWNPYLNQKGRYLATDGEEYLNELYRTASAERAPTIHAYDKNVRHRADKGLPSLTSGRQHSVNNGVYNITE